MTGRGAAAVNERYRFKSGRRAPHNTSHTNTQKKKVFKEGHSNERHLRTGNACQAPKPLKTHAAKPSCEWMTCWGTVSVDESVESSLLVLQVGWGKLARACPPVKTGEKSAELSN